MTWSNFSPSLTQTASLDSVLELSRKMEAEALVIDQGMRDAVRKVTCQGPHAVRFLMEKTGLSAFELASIAIDRGRLAWWEWAALQKLDNR